MPMRRYLNLPLFFMALLVLHGCQEHQDALAKVGDYSFVVPDEYLIDERIWWLPQSRDRSLIFFLNPKAALSERIVVSADSAARVCANIHNAISSQLRPYCNQNDADKANQTFDWRDLERKYEDGFKNHWYYRIISDEGEELIVASCNKSGGINNTNCTVFGEYKTLIFTFGVSDDQLKEVPMIRQSISRLLHRWEAEAAKAGGEALPLHGEFSQSSHIGH